MKIEIERQYINEELARRAKESYSFSDYVQGSATRGYESLITEFENQVNKLLEKNEVSQEDFDKVQYYSNRYSIRLANAINDSNANEASCPSVMICGPANFPTRKKEKQNARALSLYERDKGLFEVNYNNYYFNEIKNIITNKIIYSDDANAIEKLEKKIAQLKESQEEMKKLNAYYRKHKSLVGYPGLEEEKAKEMDAKILTTWYQCPSAPFALTNNNANIHRLEKRLEELKKTADKETPTEEENENYTVVRNQEQMRFQLIFNDIPSAETREILKSNGFRWSPKNQAWQRLLNENSERAYNRIKSSL